MTEQTQTVTENPPVVTTPPPQESAPVTAPDAGAQDDLDTLLAEYKDQANAPKEPQELPAEPDKKIEFVAKQVQDWQAERTQQKIETALSKATVEVRKLEGLQHVDEGVIRDLVFARANQDGRFALALLNGDAKAFRAYARSIEGKFSAPDKRLSEDRKAAQDAVRGASLQPPPETPPNLGAMSNREFFDFVKKLPK